MRGSRLSSFLHDHGGDETSAAQQFTHSRYRCALFTFSNFDFDSDEINCYRGEACDPYDRCCQDATGAHDAGFAIDQETTGEVQ